MNTSKNNPKIDTSPERVDAINLPPLPEWCQWNETVADMSTFDIQEEMQAYALAAIEADRQARGEPIGVEITALIANMAAFLEVSGDPYADPLIKHAREVLSAPQPQQAGEPVFLLKASGPLKEWTPTKAAFDIPDGEHKLYLAQPQQTPEGYKLVPIDPTERMLQAAYNAVESEGMVTTTWLRNAIYRAMLEAAPQPKGQP